MTPTRLLTAAGFAAVLAAGSAAYAQTSETTIQVDEQGNTTAATTTTTPAVIDPATGLPVSASVTTTTSAEIDPVTGLPVSESATTAGVPASSLTTSMTGEPGTVTTRTVTNGPVPDTAENRAKYGSPMSRAGKRTAAAGN